MFFFAVLLFSFFVVSEPCSPLCIEMIFLLCLFALALAEPSINDAYFCKRENAEQTLKVGAWSSDPSSFDGPIELLNIKPAYKTKVEKALRGREVDRVNGRHCCFHAMSDGAFGGDVLCKVTGLEETAFDGY